MSGWSALGRKEFVQISGICEPCFDAMDRVDAPTARDLKQFSAQKAYDLSRGGTDYYARFLENGMVPSGPQMGPLLDQGMGWLLGEPSSSEEEGTSGRSI